MEKKIMLSINVQFPDFKKKAVVSIVPGKEFTEVSSEDHKKAKQWMVMFWYPKDFTFICPTEISEFNVKLNEFKNRNTFLYGASTDSEYVHLAWRNQHPDLKDLQFPLIADTSKSLAESLGILENDEKVAYRVTYIVNPEGKIKWFCANDLGIGRNIDEVIRVLDALQTGKLTPCNWKKGEKTLN
jgi:peroxiredoxin (alkyl hydroperoxide reductase subunit C)